MQRFAAIFTLLVFSVLIGGLLSRDGRPGLGERPDFQPTAPPHLPPVVDPLGATPSGRLEVVVADAGGAPVGGAALVVRVGASTRWATTAADGRATLDGLSPGKSLLAVLAYPHLPFEAEVEPGPEPFRVVLPAPPELPAALPDIPRSRFAGRLDWRGSESPAGCEVLLLPLASPAELGGALPRSAVCDETGRFAFEGLAHGAYSLAVLPAWASGGSWPDLAAPSERELDFRADEPEHVLQLARGSIEGLVRDDQGRALQGALVVATDALNESRVWPACSTDPEGRFRVRDVPPGTYRLTCRAGEGGSAIEALPVAPGANVYAELPPFAPRKRP